MKSPLALLSDRLRHWAEGRRMTPERALARRGEDYAHRYLKRSGWRVVARNYRSAAGNEVDLIAWEGPHLVFVEVKTRASDDTSAPERAVTPEKQTRIARAARDYAQRANVEWGAVRFDVLSVVVAEGRRPSITPYRDAFGVAARL